MCCFYISCSESIILDYLSGVLPYYISLNSFPASGDFCPLLITFANSLDPDRARQRLVLIWIQTVGPSDGFKKDFFEKVWIRELTLNPLGFSPLWFEPSSGHMWESQVLLTDGQVVFLRVLRFSPTFDERSARYK